MLINVEIKSITASEIKTKLPCGLDAWLPAENIQTSIRKQFLDIKNKHNGDIQKERKNLILSFLKQLNILDYVICIGGNWYNYLKTKNGKIWLWWVMNI